VWEEAFDSIDFDNKIPWNSMNVPQVQNMSVKVPQDLTDREFIEFICINVLNDPHLLKTANIQNLIKDMSSGLIAKNGTLISSSRQQAVDILESFIHNKVNCEKMRNQPNLITKEDFI